MIFPESKDKLPFVIHEHKVGDDITYQMSIKTGTEELQFLNFARTGKMATISDSPNITRLFGSLSEDTRTEGWLTFEGETLKPERENLPGVYRIMESGTVQFGEQNDKYTEMFLESESLTGRWILRKIPNVLDKSLFSDESIYLFWKPPRQKTFEETSYNTASCACPVKTLESKFSEITHEEGDNMISKMSTDVMFDSSNNTFEGVGAAEGTWTDMFGERYVYTREFIVHNYNQQRDFLKEGGKIVIGTEHQEGMLSFNGEVTDVQLFREPIYHIRVNGIYNGPKNIESEQFGLSYEFRFKSVWSPEFQSWVPFESKTDRIDVVKRPACKICWINKVN